MTDYETDPRPLSDCLKSFATNLNGGKSYGSRPIAAAELRVSEDTLEGWMKGRKCGQEQSFRRLMTLIEADHTPISV